MDIYVSKQGQSTGAKMPKRNPVRSGGKMIHVRLSEVTRKKLRLRVAEEDTTIQDWVAGVVEKVLSTSRRKGTKK